MKYIISIVVGGISFFIFGASFHSLTGANGLPIAIIAGIIAIVFTFKKLNSNNSIKETIADGVSYVKTTSEDISSLVDDKDAEFYAIAEQEIKDDVIDNGLWSQALVKAKGDENLRKIEYMKLRVKQLKKS